MANYDAAFAFLFPLEDTHPSGQVEHDSDGATRYGLLDRWHPDLVAQGFYTAPNDVALAQAKVFYRAQYWNRIQGDQIVSDTVGAQLFSIGVNDGVIAAIKLAQGAVNKDVDGVLGPITLAAINATDEATFLAAFNAATIARYQAIAEANPAKAGDLQGWINRVNLISTFRA